MNLFRRLAAKDRARISCQRCRDSPADVCEHAHWNTGNTEGLSFFYYCFPCFQEVLTMRNPANGLPIQRVGFTGSRFGMNEAQIQTFDWLLRSMYPLKEFHHGVCLGADEQAHHIVRRLNLGAEIHGWPPKNELKLARHLLDDFDVLHEPREYKARDREIVYHTQVLIACPNSDGELLRSGTFYTMRQALASLRPIYFIQPSDGKLAMNWKSEMNEKVRAREVAEAETAAREFFEGLHPGDSRPRHPLEVEMVNSYLRVSGLPEIEVDDSLEDDEFRLAFGPPSEFTERLTEQALEDAFRPRVLPETAKRDGLDDAFGISDDLEGAFG